MIGKTSLSFTVVSGGELAGDPVAVSILVYREMGKNKEIALVVLTAVAAYIRDNDISFEDMRRIAIAVKLKP